MKLILKYLFLDVILGIALIININYKKYINLSHYRLLLSYDSKGWVCRIYNETMTKYVYIQTADLRLSECTLYRLLCTVHNYLESYVL